MGLSITCGGHSSHLGKQRGGAYLGPHPTKLSPRTFFPGHKLFFRQNVSCGDTVLQCSTLIVVLCKTTHYTDWGDRW